MAAGIKLVSTLLILFIIMMASNTTISAQDELAQILKAYPSWTTNFDKKSIKMSELMSGGPPKDGIPAITHPKFNSVEEAGNWLEDVDPVIALDVNGKQKAYPLEILIWHEIVNDRISDVPVIVTFCPLCYSAIAYDRRVNGMENKFGVSGLLRNSDMVMYDQITESFWQQFTGEAIVGDLLGKKLKMIPAQIISFKQFRENYPGGKILSRDTGFNRKYGMNPYVGYDDINQTPFLYKGPSDGRLNPNEKVIAVKIKGHPKAYPYEITKDKKVINDEIGDERIVVFHSGGAASALDDKEISDSKEAGSTGVFSRILEGKELTFTYEDDYYFDKETKSKWSVTGKAVDGKLKGSQLSIIPFGDYFAFAWFAFRPETEIYSDD